MKSFIQIWFLVFHLHACLAKLQNQNQTEGAAHGRDKAIITTLPYFNHVSVIERPAIEAIGRTGAQRGKRFYLYDALIERPTAKATGEASAEKEKQFYSFDDPSAKPAIDETDQRGNGRERRLLQQKKYPFNRSMTNWTSNNKDKQVYPHGSFYKGSATTVTNRTDDKRRKRYAYEDDTDWEYDFEEFDYDDSNEEAMISILTKNWRTLALKFFLGLCFFCFIVLCCALCCRQLLAAVKMNCKSICMGCVRPFKRCLICKCCKPDPIYTQMKEFFKMMGVHLEYETYLNMKDDIKEYMDEQGYDMDQMADAMW